MSKFYLTSSEKHFICLTHNLLGCPEIEMWTGNPQIMNDSVTIRTETNLSVSVRNIYKPKICVNGLFGGNSFHSIDSISPASFSGVPTNYTVTITKHNYIPYIAPLYLQNESVSGTHYVHTNDVNIGTNVTTEKQSGNFVITSSADVTIEPIGEVTLDVGFTVDLGGKFEVKANQ